MLMFFNIVIQMHKLRALLRSDEIETKTLIVYLKEKKLDIHIIVLVI